VTACDPLEELAAMRGRVNAAYRGPWEHPLDYEVTYGYHMKGSIHVATWIATADPAGAGIEDEQAIANAEFVAHARSDMPRLLDMADALLKLAAELDRPASDLRDPNPVVGMEAMALKHAAARIRSLIAAALAPAAEEPEP
jgi:hypothetical protein